MEQNDVELRDEKIAMLCSVPTEVDALPIKSLLESFGIKCLLQSDVARSIYPFVVDGLAVVRIMVLEKDLFKAQEILQDAGCKF